MPNNVAAYQGEDLEFDDDKYWAADRALVFLGAAALAKVEGCVLEVRRREAGAALAANDAAEFLSLIEVAHVTGRELLEAIEQQLG